MQCRGDEWCDFPDNGLCGAADASGVCRARPSICPQVCSRVCGCDGRAYCNACIASQQGVDVSGQSSSGTCP
jgi:hypothetical protein